MNEGGLIQVMRGEGGPVFGPVVRAALSALEPGYRAGVAARNMLFNLGLRRPRGLGRTTISVGNLTTGGTGKTPMVIELVRRLRFLEARPAVLLRGYRAGDQTSDEATLLTRELGPQTPVGVQPSRLTAAATLLRQHPDINVFVLDDGFQHRQVARDLDLVLVDATAPFGFGRLLPRGMLREPVGSLRRADAVLVMRADQVSGDQLTRLDQTIRNLTSRPPIAHAEHRWASLRDAHDQEHPLTLLQETDMLAVCGIGNPRAFVTAVADHAGRPLPALQFRDHHRYLAEDLERVFRLAAEEGMEAVITTEKDWVKWRSLPAGRHPPLPVYRPALHISFLDGAETLDGLLRAILARGSTPKDH